MNGSSAVWPIVALTSVALVCVTVVLLFASAQAAVIAGLCSSVILPIIGQIMLSQKQDVLHRENQETQQTIVEKLGG